MAIGWLLNSYCCEPDSAVATGAEKASRQRAVSCAGPVPNSCRGRGAGPSFLSALAYLDRRLREWRLDD